jgi:hypothetical protein
LTTNSPIDSLSWGIDNDQFIIYSYTHDNSKPYSYYKYTIEETYEYAAPFLSQYRYENGDAVYRLPDDDIYKCWITNPVSNTISITSTESLTQNIVSKFKLHSITRSDRKLWHKYSLLAKQFAINKEAHSYWEQIKRLSEDVGGLFDPIPYSVNGNIHSETNPNEKVLGYFYGGEVTESRIVVTTFDLPNNFKGVIESHCREDLVSVGNLSSLEGKDVIITIPQYNLTTIVGYYYTTPICADCRLQGGTNIRPLFMY